LELVVLALLTQYGVELGCDCWGGGTVGLCFVDGAHDLVFVVIVVLVEVVVAIRYLLFDFL
jgi:hypothetical protein